MLEPVVVVLDDDRCGVGRGDLTVGAREHAAAGVLGGAILHPGADDRRLRAEQRHGLTLHVGTHQGAVGIVVLEERDQRRRDRDDLLGRDVHELHLARAAPRRIPRRSGRRPTTRDLAAAASISAVRLGDDELVLAVGREVADLVADDAVLARRGTASR